MNRDHSFSDQVADLLAESGYQIFRSEDGSTFHFGVSTAEGIDLQLRIVCGASTRILQVEAILPVTATPSRQRAVLQFINRLNSAIPCGSLVIEPETGRIALSNSALFPEGTSPSGPLTSLLSINSAVMNEHARTLLRLVQGGLSVRAACRAISSAEPAPAPTPDPASFLWN